MKLQDNLSQVSAEMLLNYLYPEMAEDWKALCKGTFYRNYNHDSLHINEELAEVELSRDGILDLLPQGLISETDELKGRGFAGKYEAVEKRINLLREAFKPIDSFFFRQSLSIEKQVSEILEDKSENMLKEYFNFDLKAQSNKFVKKIAVLLPYIFQWKGDFAFIRKLISTITKTETEMIFGDYSDSDNTRCFLPRVKYNLLVEGLNSNEYRELSAEIKPFADFVGDYLIPYEVVCEISLKEHGKKFMTDNTVILNYNAQTAAE